MYVLDDDDDDEVKDSSVLSRRRRKRKKVRPEVTTTLRPRSTRNKPHLMSNCVRRRMGIKRIKAMTRQVNLIKFKFTLATLFRPGGRRRHASVRALS